jgi:hypothetical protein
LALSARDVPAKPIKQIKIQQMIVLIVNMLPSQMAQTHL